jgi:hypothetical protein
MDNLHKEALSLLKGVGAVLVRCKRHEVYKLPNGRIVVLAKTPGNNGTRNELSRVKKAIREL